MDTQIKNLFAKLVSQLNKNKIYPIIYGSLGLALKINKDIKVNDIDFIIDNSKSFDICKKIMEAAGFKLDPDHDREFIGKNLNISFLDKKEIEKLINETLILENTTLGNSVFFNLDIQQYLKIYQRGLKNKYRKEKKQSDDLKKIKLIKEYLLL